MTRSPGPSARARSRSRAPQLVLDCLERDASCLDLQMLGEAADSSPSCKMTLEVKIAPIKRRRSFR